MNPGPKGKIYRGPNNGRAGGHAVVGVGFGEDNGVKYWLLQNSWGPNWNGDGYCKFERGINLADIEKRAAWFKVETAGGTMFPPCFDGAQAGSYTFRGKPLTCPQAITYRLCTHASVKGSCPVSCGVCTATPTPPPTPPQPTSPPTPAPTPPPTPPPAPTAPGTSVAEANMGTLLNMVGQEGREINTSKKHFELSPLDGDCYGRAI